jgi:hypothetical protein
MAAGIYLGFEGWEIAIKWLLREEVLSVLYVSRAYSVELQTVVLRSSSYYILLNLANIKVWLAWVVLYICCLVLHLYASESLQAQEQGSFRGRGIPTLAQIRIILLQDTTLQLFKSTSLSLLWILIEIRRN